MDKVLALIVVSMIGESVWETLKMVWKKGKFNFNRIGALAVSIILSIGTGVNILEIANIGSKIPYLGTVLTGILISRGANFTHDIVASINNVYKKTKPCMLVDGKDVKKGIESIEDIKNEEVENNKE